MMLSARNNNSKYPFTETQWQELEHQALIFKYMISGIPIPPELIFTVQKSLISNQQPGGWGCYGRKADPEPGRCRRTDGKKWRCSKEAFPDSKYCERHMHRTKNRSRKPVESSSAIKTTTSTSSVLSLSSPSSSPSSSSSSSLVTDHHNISTHPYLNPYSPRNSTATHLSAQNNTPHEMILGSNYSDNKDFRYFFPESSGTLTSLPESYTPFGGYPSSQLLQADHHVAASNPPNQQMHHFFSEKWPQKDATDSWLNYIDQDHHHHGSTATQSSSSFSTTQLSMFLPMSSNNNPNGD